MKLPFLWVSKQQADKPRCTATLRHCCHFNTISVSHRCRGVVYNMAGFAVVKVSLALLLLASSDCVSADEGSNEDGLHVTDEGEDGAPAYNFGETASASARRPSNVC